MNALVKKEIRLLLPSWIVAALLAMVQGITRPYDFYIASLLFFGLTIMSLSTIGRETSLNTFSSLMLAQPAERLRIWQVKLSVLAVAFLTVFLIWLAAFGIAFLNSNVDVSDRKNSYNLFITISLIAAATFTGGLWSTLLLRQLAGAFWLTLLVPATLSGLATGFSAGSESDNLVIAVLSVVIGIYSIAGFLFARRLFFRAQDVGWSGGVITMPEWKFLSVRTGAAKETRRRKPILALFKKELQLQQGVLTGALGLLVIHVAVIGLRIIHPFQKESAGDELTAIVWMFWLAVPVLVGSIAVAEERKQGVMEGQLCLPVSRRVQFTIKASWALLLGTLLGGALPMLLEDIGLALHTHNPVFTENPTAIFELGIVALAGWLALVSFFASSLAKNFLQAVGIALVIFVGLTMCLPALANYHMVFSIGKHSFLPMVMAVPTVPVVLVWLAYLNFSHFRDGWPLWRRNLMGAVAAVVFIGGSSTIFYHRAWEVLEPAEPAHGPAKLSLANPPELHVIREEDLLVRLPDGRVWFNSFGNPYGNFFNMGTRLQYTWHTLIHPLPESLGPQRFVAGSNWVTAATEKVFFGFSGSPDRRIASSGFFDTVGIRPDGTLWVSGKSQQNLWTSDTLEQFGNETDWKQIELARTSVFLLKSNGTLWRWGPPVTTNWPDWSRDWPGLRAFTPRQIGAESDWTELFRATWVFARKADGRVWRLDSDWKTGKDELVREINLDEVVSGTVSDMGDQRIAYVRADGSLWVLNRYWDPKTEQLAGAGSLQVGKENNWRAVAVNDHAMTALKADGTLWRWTFPNNSLVGAIKRPPELMGIHHDWVALSAAWRDVIACAADGSVWLWPDRNDYEYDQALLELPKQPQFLGNVFSQAN